MGKGGALRRLRILIVIAVLATMAVVFLPRTAEFRKLVRKFSGSKTVDQRLAQYGPAARERLKPSFEKAGVQYPPKKIVMLVLKKEKRLELYAAGDHKKLTFVRNYPVLAASGSSGPKLCEGDCQVPEGIYRIVFLNPNSLWHLSLRLDYPNEFDREMAKVDGRTNLGGDIMIHGNRVSIGCIAVGDKASEDLFVLATDVGLDACKVIIAPYDFRAGRIELVNKKLPAWTSTLYKDVSREIHWLHKP